MDSKPNKSVKFKSSKGVFGVGFSKKCNIYSITLDGYEIEEVDNVEAAIQNLLSLYDGHKYQP